MHGTRVWRRFQRVIKDKVLDFRVQELPSTLNDEALKMMGKNFFANEPYSAGSGMKAGKEEVSHMYNLWQNYILPHKLSVVCLKKEDENLHPEVIAVNFLVCYEKINPKLVFPDKPELFIKLYKYIQSQYNVFEAHNVTQYLEGFGLCVNEPYRGYGIATEVLLARDAICKHLGISVTSTQFSTPHSQKSAEKAGFKTSKIIKYSQIERDLNLSFPKEYNNTKIMTKVI